MIAIISDVHSNLEALNAVLNDIRTKGVKKLICLGDVVGYGPNPKDCIDIVNKIADVTILGNHDEATLFESEARYFNYRAKAAIEWTRNQLEDEPDIYKNGERWSFLGEMPRIYRDNDFLFVHGSPRNPVKEYIFPEDVIYNPEKIDDVFSFVNHVAFIGHTHLPGVFREDRFYWAPADLGNTYEIDWNKKSIINVGSVGQPRDGNPEASYAILDDNRVVFCRVSYDYRITMRKIGQTESLDRELAERLAEGR